MHLAGTAYRCVSPRYTHGFKTKASSALFSGLLAVQSVKVLEYDHWGGIVVKT